MGRGADGRERTLPKTSLDNASETALGHIRAEQLRAIARFTPAIFVVNVWNVVVLVAALHGSQKEQAALVWAFVVCTASAYLYLAGVGVRERPRSVAAPRSVTRSIAVAAGAVGGLWCLAPLMFIDHLASDAMLVIVCMCCGIMCAGAFVLASVPEAVFAFVAPVLAGSLIAVDRSDLVGQYHISLLFVVYACVLVMASLTYYRQMASRILEQIDAENAARLDGLTHLPNARAFHEFLDRALARCAEHGEQLAVLYLDLDGFKPVNDRYGHAAGDEILTQVAQRLDETVRKADFVARLGGDEFVVALVDIGGPAPVMAFVERLLRAFAAPFNVAGAPQQVGVSVGIALAPSDGLEANVLIVKADNALYQAKGIGGGASCFFDPKHAQDVQERRDLEADLRAAIENNDLQIALQPIVQIASGRIIGCEALARWRHPVRGSISPEEFIPMAERTGLIHELGMWIVRNACRVAKMMPADAPVSVNVSVAQLRSATMTADMLATIGEFGLTPGRIEIEITESLLITRDDPAIETARQLSQAGFPIALDDFGTGYASLNYLRKLPLNRVKIDKEFTRDSVTHADCAAIVMSVVQLARALNLEVTAEGVETAEQLAFLRSIGCGAAQGYLISRPVAEAEFVAMFARDAARSAAA
ncbi:MAG TPA: EAL domain-containing protein [Rhodoblastus sp.]|nr:EAL domain-containing protein [Rhodoblastus sp.]